MTSQNQLIKRKKIYLPQRAIVRVKRQNYEVKDKGEWKGTREKSKKYLFMEDQELSVDREETNVPNRKVTINNGEIFVKRRTPY